MVGIAILAFFAHGMDSGAFFKNKGDDPSVPTVWDIPERYEGKLVAHIPRGLKERVVALTFDDGPDGKNTPAVLAILKKAEIKATFFVIGQNVVHFPKVMKDIMAEGHDIGNHSYTHPSRPRQDQANGEVHRTAQTIVFTTGNRPTLYRPPYGITSNWTSKAAFARGYAVVNWTTDTNDWKKSSPIAKRALEFMRPGEIVLMHSTSGKERTVKALPTIIAGYKKKGFRFVTMTQMLDIYDKQEEANAKAAAERKARVPKPKPQKQGTPKPSATKPPRTS